MVKTKEFQFLQQTLSNMGRLEKEELISKSNLNDREVLLLTKRFVNGLSLKECSEEFKLEINSISKNQTKAVRKLYEFINR